MGDYLLRLSVHAFCLLAGDAGCIAIGPAGLGIRMSGKDRRSKPLEGTTRTRSTQRLTPTPCQLSLFRAAAVYFVFGGSANVESFGPLRPLLEDRGLNGLLLDPSKRPATALIDPSTPLFGSI